MKLESVFAVICFVLVHIGAVAFTFMTIDKIHKNDKKKVLFGAIAAVLYTLSVLARIYA